ncbi:ABC transporter ATP-binding protein [Candidimonas nitroreducens]|uniref:ABC transporter ATP-binding protein n=1 Tax=Candidimonas nitroreducens TaxID=683354 RepID=A0A225M9P1_9BURK|nr:ABC transporter ATP-binding protein [Candidimonas nitroreducens]OWT56800.1 ABC transporter ATP-binding protein [Candidimonas nitroreducens]
MSSDAAASKPTTVGDATSAAVAASAATAGGGRAASAAPLLRVQGLAKHFGAFRALDGVSFDVMPGEVLGLVGPNGSGKTTCINVITGLYRPDGGSILYQGRPVGGMAAHRLVHQGINRSFQIPKPFKTLTVRQNVEVARTYGQHGGGANADTGIGELLRFLDLEPHADRYAGELTSAQQKMLDLARALATRPKLLCVDELGAGLNPAELDLVAGRLRELARSGIALLVVEHLMDFVDQVTDRLIVLSAGKNLFEGTLSQAVQDPRVVEVFLGAPDEH